MTSPSGIVSQGTTFSIKVGSTFTPVLGFKAFSGIGGGNASVIDSTTLQSTAKEKLMGLPDEGSCKLTLNLLPLDPGQVAMESARVTQALTAFEVVLSSGTKFDFSGYVSSFDRSAGVDQLAALSVTIEISGSVTKS